jgi:hypothetical protein
MPLQKQFRGISDLLGMYQGGNTLFELNQNLGVQIDGLKFLAEPTWQFQSESDVHAIGHRVTVEIPQDEVWLIWALSGLSTIPLAVGNSISLQAIYQHESVAGREQPLGPNVSNTFLTCSPAAYANFNWNPNPGMWAMDGSIGYLVTLRVGATNTQIDWGFQVSKFKR